MHRRTVLPAAVDALCLAVFVVLGRESHDIASGIAWYLTVLWPFLVGWFVAALVLRTYASWPERWTLLAATWAGGIVIALVLRAVVTQRTTPVAFIIVAYAFIGLATFGWRLAVRALTLLRGRA
jgi:FlaA1/EpsC-like NDP-sugar epimerase